MEASLQHKVKEIAGSGIFAVNREDDTLESGSANPPNKTESAHIPGILFNIYVLTLHMNIQVSLFSYFCMRV